MEKTLIVARMRPGSEQDIASVFAASDATELPRRIGVQSRTLFRFHDLYMHLIEAEQPLSAAVDEHDARTRCSGKSARTSRRSSPPTTRIRGACRLTRWRRRSTTGRARTSHDKPARPNRSSPPPSTHPGCGSCS